jgi:hypothetical protein
MPRLRTVAFLMLLAGLSLGIFTSRALRAMSPEEIQAGPRTGAHPRIEYQVDLLRSYYNLTETQANRIRQVYYGYDEKVHARIVQLRQEHAADFRAYSEEAQEAIDSILKEAAPDR